MAYQADLLDPRWQKRRGEIWLRDEYTCLRCGRSDLTLVVHHRDYYGKPWEVGDLFLETLCLACHRWKHTGQIGRTPFDLEREIFQAHDRQDWDEVWRLAHLVDFKEN